MSLKPLAIIAGVGGGTGSAVAKRFAKSYATVLLARSNASLDPVLEDIKKSGGEAFGIQADLTDESSMNNAFRTIREQYKASERGLAAAVYNGAWFGVKPLLDFDLDEFEGGWKVMGRGAFLFSKATLPLLLETVDSKKVEHPPTLLFTGATAAIKAGANFSAFSAGKWAQRAISQSLAKEVGPKGVHVGHVIIDGIIDGPRTKGYGTDLGPEGKLNPDGIAEAYWGLHSQSRSNWTWEMDLRPWTEKW